ncbi:MAG: hypothetical protein ACRDZY_19415, partial [Acidimicrobiales bacterium]
VEIVVIRSNYDIPDSSVTPSERHVAPPPMAELLAEEHGLVDTGAGPPDPNAYATLKARDGAPFAGGTPDPLNRGVDYYDLDNLGVPYLFDVLARTATGAIPSGSQVKTTYNRAPITRSSLEGEPGGRQVAMPSSVNPAKPLVRSVLPAWAFTTSSSGSTETSTREGGLLRIYLDRPWWSSGPGELLGVILDDDSNDTVTGYGSDPMHPNVPSPGPGLSWSG